MSRKEWYSPWPYEIGKVVSEQLSKDGRHKVFIFEMDNGRYTTYVYEFTDADEHEAAGWFRIEGPSITDSLMTAKEIATEAVKRLSKINKGRRRHWSGSSINPTPGDARPWPIRKWK